ncbi:MAG: hypothetical protein ABIH36_00210 [bacterium]
MKSNWRRIVGLPMVVLGGLGIVGCVIGAFESDSGSIFGALIYLLIVINGIYLWRKGTNQMKEDAKNS